jgi:RNA polymerase sigma factor (sigma-70 family)
MRSRDTILDLFSTFALLEDDRVRQWWPEPSLRRQMQHCLKDAAAPDSSVSEKVWSLYWYKIWQSEPDGLAAPSALKPAAFKLAAQQHLAAYLQESCYWTAQKTVQRFPQLEFTLSDYFQLASMETARVLKGFNPNFGTSLKSYAPIVLTNFLKDYLRQRRAIDVCSDWALLRKMSQKRITEVLQYAGIGADELAQYRFAWVCFKTIAVPMQRPTGAIAPSEAAGTVMWQTIADLYNSKASPQLGRLIPALTPEQLESRLKRLTRWIREYCYPTVDSLNKIKPGQEQGEIQDSLADPVATSLLAAAIAAESDQARQQQRSQLHSTLAGALTGLDQTAQQILRLFYRDNLSQQELADRMAMSQPTVSRRLKKAEAALLRDLLDSVQPAMHKPADPTELKHISLALKEWLEYYHRGSSS